MFAWLSMKTQARFSGAGETQTAPKLEDRSEQDKGSHQHHEDSEADKKMWHRKNLLP
jgi:hypothetical protein